jgi:predicted nucleic acid-binding protein
MSYDIAVKQKAPRELGSSQATAQDQAAALKRLDALVSSIPDTDLSEDELTASVDAVAADPSDNKFIAAAIEGRGDYIISGDRHLLDIKAYEGIPIISARQFISKISNA